MDKFKKNPQKSHRSLDVLDSSIKQSHDVIEIGDYTIDGLATQKNKLIKMTGDVDQLNENVTFLGKIMTKIQIGQNKEKLMCIILIVLLTITDGILLYLRLSYA